MNERTRLIRELVEGSHYVVDEVAIAEAIIVRSTARRMLPDVSFRSTPRARLVRSFRRHNGARSFRLSRAVRRPPHSAGDALDAVARI